MVAMYTVCYNFIKMHKTPRMPPAIEARADPNRARKMKHAMLAVAVALAAIPALAAESRPNVPLWYGRDLQRLCGADGKSAEHAMCWSYISAVVEIVNNNSIYALKVCIPPLINVQKAIDLTTKWL